MFTETNSTVKSIFYMGQVILAAPSCLNWLLDSETGDGGRIKLHVVHITGNRMELMACLEMR